MSNARRSLSDTLSRRERAFLGVAEEPANTLADATEEPSEPSLDSEHTPPHIAPAPRRTAKTSRAIGPVRRPEPLRSVTLRFRASVADALRRESIKRSMDYIEPFSQQAIVEAAVSSWLRDQGYRFDDEHLP